MKRALLVVDVQKDFCPGGSLAVEGGDRVARRITEWADARGNDYEIIVATMDWHPAPNDTEGGFPHFSDTPDFRDTWPPHCVRGTSGAELHPDLSLPEGTVVVHKGQTGAAYSGFEGSDDSRVLLGDLLRSSAIEEVDIVGIATDYCVLATAIDARREGLATRVLLPLTAGVSPDTVQRAIGQMRFYGIEVVEV